VPRNAFVGTPIHRVDIRVFRRFKLGHESLEGSFEVFNLFNHQNLGSYVTAESSPAYGQPTQNLGVSYQPRMAQIGARLTF
jgi:hypothetical protein